MGELVRLVFDRLDDFRVGMSHVHYRDAAGEIDKLVALDINKNRALTVYNVILSSAGNSFGDECVS